MAATLAILLSAPPARAATALPFCPGFTVVTAVSEGGVDYESIKTVESVSEAGVRFRYSAEKMEYDWLSPDPPGLSKTLTFRTVRLEDFDTANLFLQHFGEQLPEMVPETVAVSIGRGVHEALKSSGSAEFGVFIPFNVDKPGIDQDQHPNVYDNKMVATATLAGEPEPFALTLNGEAVELPAIRFEADFYGDRAEFFILDDPANPIALKFRIGIDAVPALTPEEIEQRTILGMPTEVSPDKESLQVVKIISPCVEVPAPAGAGEGGAGPGDGAGEVPEPGGGGGDAAAPVEVAASKAPDLPEAQAPPVSEPTAEASLEAAAIAEAIETEGRIDIQSIFFTVDSAELRPESDGALDAIAQVLKTHPDWRLSVEGHTDAQADEAYNLELSRRRAQAVRQALIERYEIAPDRLEATGHGEARPVGDNGTLEGRARNRRVELVQL